MSTYTHERGLNLPKTQMTKKNLLIPGLLVKRDSVSRPQATALIVSLSKTRDEGSYTVTLLLANGGLKTGRADVVCGGGMH